MKNIVVIVIVIVIILGGIWYFTSNSNTPEAGNQVSPAGNLVSPEPSPESPPAAENVITVTSSGFSPSSITIKKGETITFMSESSQPSWPASAIHPTHTVYPGSDIKKCGTQDQPMIFDACMGLVAGEQWTFQFDTPGTWKYHDHLNPSHYGTIIVE